MFDSYSVEMTEEMKWVGMQFLPIFFAKEIWLEQENKIYHLFYTLTLSSVYSAGSPDCQHVVKRHPFSPRVLICVCAVLFSQQATPLREKCEGPAPLLDESLSEGPPEGRHHLQ